MITDHYPKFKEAVDSSNRFKDLVADAADSMAGLKLEMSAFKCISSLKMEQIIPLSFATRAFRIKQATMDPCKLIEKYVNDEDKLKALFRQFTVNYWLEALMDQGRNQWIKPSGCGSQDGETRAQEMIASLIMSGVEDLKQHAIDNDW